MKMMKIAWYIIPFIVVATLLVVTSGCNSRQTQRRRPPFRVGYNTYIGYQPLAIAQERRLFAQEGVEVELVYHADLWKMMSDFVAGRIDAVGFPMDVLMRIYAKDPDARIVLFNGSTAGSDAVVAQP